MVILDRRPSWGTWDFYLVPALYLFGIGAPALQQVGEHAWKCHGCAELLPFPCPVQLAKYGFGAPGPVTPAVAWADWVCPCSPATWVTSFQEQAHRSKFLWDSANLPA